MFADSPCGEAKVQVINGNEMSFQKTTCVLYTLNYLTDIHTGLIKTWVWNCYTIIISQISALWGLVTQLLPY